MQQIRLTKTPEIEKVLTFLRRKYSLLSEAEIIKLALAEKYHNELEEPEKNQHEVKKAYQHAMEEGKKLGDKLLSEKGLKREDVTEEEFYDLFLNKHKHDA